MRVFLYFMVMIVAVVVVTGCKKEAGVAPATHQVIKLATIDSASLNGGGDNGPKVPHK